MKRLFMMAAALIVVVVSVQAQEGGPRYKVDADWPKRPLPNKWFFGGITGLEVDSNDNVWVLSRPANLDETENYATLKPPTDIDRNGVVWAALASRHLGQFDRRKCKGP